MIEILSLLGGGLFGAFLKIWSQASRDKHERNLAAMQVAELNAKLINQARAHNDEGFSITRRIIAVSCIFSIVILPKLITIFDPNLGVWVSSEVLERGFLFFTDSRTVTEWNYLKGFVITPIDTMIVSAVIGMYFGASVAKR